MPTHLALLKAVNLGSHNKIAMSALRELGTTLGFRDVQTLLQSGNVVFSSKKGSSDALELLWERGAEKNLGLSTQFFVRTAGEWSDIIAGNPFKREAKTDPGHLVVLLLKSAPPAKSVAALQSAIVGNEEIRVGGTFAYATYPDGIGNSKLTTALIERKLSTRVTARNWNTVLKIKALLEAPSS